MLSNLMEIRDASKVRRYHTKRIVGEHQTLADHQYGVAIICNFLCNGKASANLLMKALTHDLSELYTGDIPAIIKRRNSVIGEELRSMESEIERSMGLNFNITSEEEIILKIADTMELLLYCIEQKRMGNTTLDEVFNNGFLFIYGSEIPNSDICLNEIIETLMEVYVNER